MRIVQLRHENGSITHLMAVTEQTEGENSFGNYIITATFDNMKPAPDRMCEVFVSQDRGKTYTAPTGEPFVIHKDLTMTWEQFSSRYCETQDQTPHLLCDTLQAQVIRFAPTGWMLAECQMMDGSRLGEVVCIPFGPRNTMKFPPDRPFSPRGLASDMSVVIGVLFATSLPNTTEVE